MDKISKNAFKRYSVEYFMKIVYGFEKEKINLYKKLQLINIFNIFSKNF